jgi:hypothetical protein
MKAKFKKLAQPGKREIVEVQIEGETIRVEIRELNVAGKSALFSASGGMNEDGTPKDLEALSAEAARLCAYDPESGERIFSTRAEVLGAGPQIDPVVQKALGMLNTSDVPGKSETTANTEPALPSPSPSESSPTK